MISARRRDTAQRLKYVVIIVVVMLAVTLPLWGIFVGGMLREGDVAAAFGMFGTILGLVLLPVAIVADFALLFHRVAQSAGRSLHPGLIIGLGAVLGAGLMLAFTAHPVTGLLLGAVPGAMVAVAVLPGRPRSGFSQDEHDA